MISTTHIYSLFTFVDFEWKRISEKTRAINSILNTSFYHQHDHYYWDYVLIFTLKIISIIWCNGVCNIVYKRLFPYLSWPENKVVYGLLWFVLCGLWITLRTTYATRNDASITMQRMLRLQRKSCLDYNAKVASITTQKMLRSRCKRCLDYDTNNASITMQTMLRLRCKWCFDYNASITMPRLLQF